MSNLIHITRFKNDTRRATFHIATRAAPAGIDLTSWTNFELIVDTLQYPEDLVTRVKVLTGVSSEPLVGDVYFVFDGTIPTGDYFYNMRGSDINGERITLAFGNLKVKESM